MKNLNLVKTSLKAVAVTAALGFFASTGTMAQEAAATLDQLLQQVKEGALADTQVLKEREAQFTREKQAQAQLLAEAKKERDNLEKRSAELEAQHAANEETLKERRATLDERLGVLKELFGTVQAVAGDTRSNMVESLVSAQYPGRVEVLDKLIDKIGSNTQLPTMAELEELWYFMQQEMTESGKVVKFNATVVSPDGEHTDTEVVRVGTFNIVSGGDYLNFDSAANSLEILPRQPERQYTSSASDLQSATSGFTQFGIDPTGPSGGSYLEALIDTPDLKERWQQGREVGYVITVLGVIALLISIWRLIVLTTVSGKVTSQLKNPSQLSDKNPLGRVLKVAEENPGADTETLELKLHEAILKETPKLEAWVGFIKITSMVAPLLGLLGTVTGMILTFQALTIFGTGDPKAMAGGISSALVTTVLGLVVAIPTVFLHAIVSGRSKKVIHILEEQTAGIVAEQSEKSH